VKRVSVSRGAIPPGRSPRRTSKEGTGASRRHSLDHQRRASRRLASRRPRAESEFLQAGDLGLRERLELEVRQRRPAPRRERVAQERRRPWGIGGFERPSSLFEQPLESVEVEPVLRDLRYVSGDRARIARPEESAQLVPAGLPLSARHRRGSFEASTTDMIRTGVMPGA
jgi:hypothetical protein